MTRRSITVGQDRFVIGPWHDDPATAYVGLAPSRQTLTSRASVERCIEHLAGQGYRSAVTAALRANDAHVFAAAGFGVRERLKVLRHDLTGPWLEQPLDPRLRRARRRDRPEVLALDGAAFEPFWALGADGLDEALHATSSVRFRVLDAPDPAGTEHIAGYAVCGRSLEIGYLQRLAVHPDLARRGIGAALVVDALRWLRRRRSRMMLVNTQESNGRALALYLRLGFVLEPEPLTVMQWASS